MKFKILGFALLLGLATTLGACEQGGEAGKEGGESPTESTASPAAEPADGAAAPDAKAGEEGKKEETK